MWWFTLLGSSTAIVFFEDLTSRPIAVWVEGSRVLKSGSSRAGVDFLFWILLG